MLAGWKEWGSWSSWSVKCGPVEHKRTRGRTRDCRGMDGKIGTDSSCPCNAKFDIAECSFRDDNVVNEDNQCPNLNTATTLWANRVAAGDHDQNDPGYLEIVQEDIHICREYKFIANLILIPTFPLVAIRCIPTIVKIGNIQLKI